MATTILCTVTVLAREGFGGYWCAGRHFAHGTTEVELTQAEFEAIRADQALRLPISVVEGVAEPAPPPAPPAAPPEEPEAPPAPPAGKRSR